MVVPDKIIYTIHNEVLSVLIDELTLNQYSLFPRHRYYLTVAENDAGNDEDKFATYNALPTLEDKIAFIVEEEKVDRWCEASVLLHVPCSADGARRR